MGVSSQRMMMVPYHEFRTDIGQRFELVQGEFLDELSLSAPLRRERTVPRQRRYTAFFLFITYWVRRGLA